MGEELNQIGKALFLAVVIGALIKLVEVITGWHEYSLTIAICFAAVYGWNFDKDEKEGDG